jgi:glyoxylase-like metal-dependent hydrolase (beta-lactamase superfamily II)
MEIAPGVHQIHCAFGTRRMVFVYLLIGETASLLVDTGCAHNPAQEILPYMASIGFDPQQLTYILITHSDLDHQGGNAAMLAAAPQSKLLCHRLDRPWIEDTEALIAGRYSQFEADHGIGYGEGGKAGIRNDCHSTPVDITLRGGEQFRLSPGWEIEALHTPGHTWGHLAVFDPRSATLVSGEASMWNAILDTDWLPAMPPTYCYVDTYLATQDRLLAMPVDQLASAHWPIQRGAAVREYITESRNYVLHVESALLDYAGHHPGFTLRAAADELGPTLGRWPAAANLEFSYGMAGNLESLTKRGLLRTERNAEGKITWRLA